MGVAFISTLSIITFISPSKKNNGVSLIMLIFCYLKLSGYFFSCHYTFFYWSIYCFLIDFHFNCIKSLSDYNCNLYFETIFSLIKRKPIIFYLFILNMYYIVSIIGIPRQKILSPTNSCVYHLL